ncbi:transmembrane emp24 domain-containing protein 1-like [Elysia marginata]|uniref:Transmembrane emp24 domain-containing protein 1-like n=1 Tax=Elysia marginata TaxID=1093978 RepID=A0AAV4EJW7_9GAST|nr:transmembrane emp24 domain-containing protein 1-like [Elysia marginata]
MIIFLSTFCRHTRVTSEGKGDYRICFDNSFSTFSNKVVFFEIFIEDGRNDDDEDEEHKLAMQEDYKAMETQLDMTVEQFLGILDRSKKNLERSVQVQTLIRIHEAKDRNTQEANFWRVNFFSCFQLAVMMVVGLGQVIMIRSLFQDKRPVSGSSLKART